MVERRLSVNAFSVSLYGGKLNGEPTVNEDILASPDRQTARMETILEKCEGISRLDKQI